MGGGIFDSVFRLSAIAGATGSGQPPAGDPDGIEYWRPDYGKPDSDGVASWPVNDDSWGHPREAKPAPEATHGEYQPYTPWGFESTSRRFAAIPWDGRTAYGEYWEQHGRIVGIGLIAVGSFAYMLSQQTEGVPHPVARLLGSAVGVVGSGLMLLGSLTTLTQISVANSQNKSGVKKVVRGEDYRCWTKWYCDLNPLK